jgi:hypothetical protein
MQKQGYDQTMTKQLAKEIVGDGQTPNLWFVTFSPYYHTRENGNSEFELLEGYTDADSETFGPFASYEYAKEVYDNQELDHYSGVGSVCIEDRMWGTVTEKFLEKRIVVDYSYQEFDDSKRFYGKDK